VPKWPTRSVRRLEPSGARFPFRKAPFKETAPMRAQGHSAPGRNERQSGKKGSSGVKPRPYSNQVPGAVGSGADQNLLVG
jgi:hypothetical protein